MMTGWMDVDRWRDRVAAVVGQGGPAGAAFFTHGLLLTCTHVLSAAGWSPARYDAPVQIRLREPEGGYRFVAARIVPGQVDPVADVALLRPVAPLADGVVDLPLAPAGGSAGRLVVTFGFPDGYRDGLRGQARVLGLIPHQGRERLQLRSTEVTGGFSGGPLWDPLRQAVIGVVHSGTRADQMGRLPFTTFGVPTEVLLQVCDRLSVAPAAPGPRSEPPVTIVRDGEETNRDVQVARLIGGDFPENVARRVRQEPERWHEIGRLAGVQVARERPFAAWSLAEALSFREPDAPDVVQGDLWGALVAAQVVVETADLSRVGRHHLSRLERLRRWLLHIMGGDSLPALRRAEAGRLLARLGDPRGAVTNVERMEFCLVAGGPFLLGSGDDDPLAYLEERPQRPMEIPYDYWLGRFPVTRAQFAAFVGAGGYSDAALWPEARAHGLWEGGALVDRIGGRRREPEAYGAPYELPNHPVVGVTWYEATAFARWLTARWRESGRLPAGWHICLPAEAEWEKGARGGTLLPLQRRVATPTPLLLTRAAPLPQRPNPAPGRIYPWGNGRYNGRQANGQMSGIGSTSAAGCFGMFPSPVGCEEMVGNVVEWTRDRWRDAGDESAAPRHGVDGIAARFSYYGSHEKWLRCAARGGLFPYGRDANIGFRVAIVPEYG